MPNLPRLPYLADKTKKLPTQPGIYIMKDKAGEIIYVGKAKSLKNRVSSYFRSVEKHLPKVYKMVENVHDFEYIVTRSEFEALILECSFIKQHSPKYNILLKDDKGYHYIKISPGDYGKITATHQKLEDGSRYIGPYISSFVTSQTVDEVNKAFLLPTCNRNFPQDIRKGRPCLNFHIKQCMAPCTGKISVAEYNEALEQAIDFIKGDNQEIQKRIFHMMEEAAEKEEYEKAARYRDRLNAIKNVGASQKVVSVRYEEQDVIALVQGTVSACAVVLKFRSYKLVDKEYFMLEPAADASDAAEQRARFLMEYYDMKGEVPKTVVLDADPEHREELQSFLSEKAAHSVTLHIPQKGDQMELIRMAKENASQHISERSRRSSREINALDELSRLLGLNKIPEYIEAYDISNIGSDTIVAGMVVFDGGRPLRGAYRKFAIKSVVDKPDDYASMQEVLQRRFERYAQHKAEGIGFGRMPDLILLDGGKGHVAAVKPLVRSMGYDVPIFGMAKDDRHRTRTITTEDGELSVSSFKSAFDLLTSIQDEVHRFSIEYSRSKHQNKTLDSVLKSVPGIGPKRAQNLFLRFKTLKAMKAATVEELELTPGITTANATALYKFLHENDPDTAQTLDKSEVAGDNKGE